MQRALTILLLATLGSCQLFGNDSPTVAGQYGLTLIDSQPPPCCGVVDSGTGARTTTLSGTLILGDAAPEAFVTTPAGYYPASCVYEVPNGATVSPTDSHRCGDGDFSLTFVQRVDSANGASTTKSVVTTGRYAWSDKDAMIKLVDGPMLGTVTLGANRTLQMRSVNVTGTYGPTYTFSNR